MTSRSSLAEYGLLGQSWESPDGVLVVEVLADNPFGSLYLEVREGEITVVPTPTVDFFTMVETHLTASASVVETFYSPTQPRHPKGTSSGGRFAPKTGGGSAGLNVGPLLSRRFQTMAPETPDQALRNSNPLDGDVNCQMTTSAYELRRRGLDVVARRGIGGPPGADWSSWFEFPDKDLTYYHVPEEVVGQPEEFRDWVSSTISGVHPPGSRGFFAIQGPVAHITNWERGADGGVRFLDAQSREDFTDDLTDTWKVYSGASTRHLGYEVVPRVQVPRTDLVRANDTGLVRSITDTTEVREFHAAKSAFDSAKGEYTRTAWPKIQERKDIEKSLRDIPADDGSAEWRAAKNKYDRLEIEIASAAKARSQAAAKYEVEKADVIR